MQFAVVGKDKGWVAGPRRNTVKPNASSRSGGTDLMFQVRLLRKSYQIFLICTHRKIGRVYISLSGKGKVHMKFSWKIIVVLIFRVHVREGKR